MKPASETPPSSTGPPNIDLRLQIPASLKLLKGLAETWGGGWKGEGLSGGRLVIPVLAGLRRGYVGFAVSADGSAQGTRLQFVEEESDLTVHKPTLVILLIAAAAALTCLLVPFVPRLLPLLPPSIVISLATWMFIVARLRNSGLDEFLADLKDEATEGDDG